MEFIHFYSDEGCSIGGEEEMDVFMVVKIISLSTLDKII